MNDKPQLAQIEQLMRGDRIVAGGFFGQDSRSLGEIIEADAQQLKRLNVTVEQLAIEMEALRDLAAPRQGNPALSESNLRVRCEENRGRLICPFGDGTQHLKTVTHAHRTDSGKSLRWSDLNIHLIAAHGFFEGAGSAFRLEPAELVEMLLR